MKTGSKVLIGILAVVLIFVFWLGTGYNSFTRQRENVNAAQSQIDNLLERRMDLIPNLIATVKGYANHEESVIDDISSARAQMSGAKTTEEKLNADDNLSQAVSRLLVVVENYPDLKANEQFNGLMDELAGTENRISTARRDYNNTAKAYNQKISVFPNNIVAGMFGFQKFDYFKAKEGADNVPTVDFNS